MCINKQSKLKVVKKNISLSFEARRHFPHIDALIKKKNGQSVCPNHSTWWQQLPTLILSFCLIGQEHNQICTEGEKKVRIDGGDLTSCKL